MSVLASLVRRGRNLSDIARQIGYLAVLGPNGARVDMSRRFVKLTIECFDYKRTPDGEPWAAPKDMSNVSLLVKTGALRNGNKAFVNSPEVGVISTNWKSPFHIKDNKMGGGGIRPGRPWLPKQGYIPTRWEAEAKRAISIQFWRFIKP